MGIADELVDRSVGDKRADPNLGFTGEHVGYGDPLAEGDGLPDHGTPQIVNPARGYKERREMRKAGITIVPGTAAPISVCRSPVIKAGEIYPAPVDKEPVISTGVTADRGRTVVMFPCHEKLDAAGTVRYLQLPAVPKVSFPRTRCGTAAVNDFLVHPEGLFSDVVPGKMFEYARPAVFAHLCSKFRVFQDPHDIAGNIRRVVGVDMVPADVVPGWDNICSRKPLVPRAPTTTGLAIDIASVQTMPNGSYFDGNTQTSLAA